MAKKETTKNIAKKETTTRKDTTKDIYKIESTETVTEYIDRIIALKSEIGTWAQVADIINSHTGENRKPESYSRRATRNKKAQTKSSPATTKIETDALIYDSEQAALLQELRTEKQRIMDEKRIINGWMREEARMDNFQNDILDTMNKLLKPSTVKIPKIKPSKTKRGAILNIADIHFGKEFEMYDFEGNITNAYNDKICFERLNKLLAETKEICKREDIKELDVFSLGDLVEGDLRPQTRYNLRHTMPEQIIMISNFLAKWFEEMSTFVKIRYHQTSGNHGDLRLDGSKSGQDPRNNIEMIAETIIGNWNRNNQNFQTIHNPTGFCFATVCGYKVLGIHGETANLQKAILEYSNLYKTEIDYLMAGHMHHQHYKNTGEKRGYIGVGSIVGSDTFSKKLRRASDASASLIIFEKDKGIVTNHTIALN